jgi:hypothetical protein
MGPVQPEINPQTKYFCDRLGIDDPLFLALSRAGRDVSLSSYSFDESRHDTTLHLDESWIDRSIAESEQSFTKRASLSLPPLKLKLDVESDDNIFGSVSFPCTFVFFFSFFFSPKFHQFSPCMFIKNSYPNPSKSNSKFQFSFNSFISSLYFDNQF